MTTQININDISLKEQVMTKIKLGQRWFGKKEAAEYYNIKPTTINKYISLPVFLFLMVVLAAIFTIGSLRNKQNFYYVIISIFTCVTIFYFKDLSIALGQVEKISLTLSVWMPLLLIGLFCSIGVIQINEK